MTYVAKACRLGLCYNTVMSDSLSSQMISAIEVVTDMDAGDIFRWSKGTPIRIRRRVRDRDPVLIHGGAQLYGGGH